MKILPPLTFVLHDDRLEVTFTARDMVKRQAADVVPGPYRRYGLALNGIETDAQATAAFETLLRSARATMDVLESDFSDVREPHFAFASVADAGLPVCIARTNWKK